MKIIALLVVLGFIFVVGAILKFCFENTHDYFIKKLKHIENEETN